MSSNRNAWLAALLTVSGAGCATASNDGEDFELGFTSQAADQGKTRTPSNDKNWQAWVDCTEGCRFDYDRCTVANPGDVGCIDDKVACDAVCDVNHPPDWARPSADPDGRLGDWNPDTITTEIHFPRAELEGIDGADTLAPDESKQLDTKQEESDLKLTDQEAEALFFRLDGLKEADLGGDTVGGGLDTLDPKNGVAEFVCYPRGCVCSDVTTLDGYGCEGMAAECSRRGLPITCTTRSLICGCFSRVSQ